jgi:hypothetical protein
MLVYLARIVKDNISGGQEGGGEGVGSLVDRIITKTAKQ